jgi:hypothetical protein
MSDWAMIAVRSSIRAFLIKPAFRSKRELITLLLLD